MLAESKGLLVLLAALETLAAKGLPFEAVLVGEWQGDEIRREASARLAGSGLDRHVRVAGVLTGDALWRQYAASHIFCFPSHFEAETFGLVVAEAMQFELPVVATAWRGIPSVVQDGVTGFLVPPRDPEAVAAQLAQLIGDPSLRRTMGEAGRRRYLERFGMDEYYRRMGEVFRDLAEGIAS
jgi:glycosyltransferase involved in cell wall biosynthesis